MEVRPATIADIERCKRLDGSYSTGYIWHMDESIRPDEVSVGFRRVRLPRTVEARDPRCDDDLFEVWQNSRCFLVADELGVVLGYLSMVVRRDNWQGWIEHLVVHRPYRRRGAQYAPGRRRGLGAKQRAAGRDCRSAEQERSGDEPLTAPRICFPGLCRWLFRQRRSGISLLTPPVIKPGQAPLFDSARLRKV